MTVSCICPQCGCQFEKDVSHWNRSQKIGAPVYCGKVCSGLARRLKNPPTPAERKAMKAEYDRQYRALNADEMKAKKAEYFKRTYDPKKTAVERKKRAPLHAEYCRQPEYKAWKSEYDRKHRAKKLFGTFADAALLLQDIEQEIEKRATRYEIYMTNGTINKAQTRRRSL